MSRIFNTGPGNRSINQGGRVPLSRFNEPITVLRVTAVPSGSDTSWIRNAVRMGNFMAAYEPGEIVLVSGEKQKDKELFLFLVHGDDANEFTLSDYVIRGDEIYHVQGYVMVGGKRGYVQLNTRSWGHVKEGDFVLDTDKTDLVKIDPTALVGENGEPLTDGEEQLGIGDNLKENLFWENT